MSDTEAKQMARRMVAAIDKAKKTTNQALETRDANGYRLYAKAPLQKEIDAWPGNIYVENRAVIPYKQCDQAARDWVEYGDTFFVYSDNVRNRQYREHNEQQFDKNYSECKAAIASSKKQRPQ